MENEEIKEILDLLNFNKDTILNRTCRVEDFMSREQIIKLLDYITNLQQDLDKANDIIEKDRQFYKCRLDENIKLRKENKSLKYSEEFWKDRFFRQQVYDDSMRICNKEYLKRIDKAINKLYEWGEILDNDFHYIMLNILQGSDEE